VARPAPSESSQDTRYTVDRYLALFDEGVLDRDDRVELLEGWWWGWLRRTRGMRRLSVW